MIDIDAIVLAYLLTDSALNAIVSERIYCPDLIEGAELPALGFFSRGGPPGNPHIPPIVMASVQFDCWAKGKDTGPVVARQIYRALFDALQGIENVEVVTGGETYHILSAREEVPGQDIVDPDTPDRYKVLTYFEIIAR